ncbi:hypothetical protein MPSEU_000284400 [Mayamaea pseudoterrestris]|nr:hypothetical protein MPSEU_000284400 [Mayamaea pseudoterrestris]
MTENTPLASPSASNFDVSPVSSDNGAFFDMLGEGFAALRMHQYGPSDAQIQLETTPEFLRHAIVNFIDPTASSKSMQLSASPTATNSKAALDLYEKLTLILRTEYNATLKKVPYTNFRSGANGVIDSLMLKTYMTGSQGGLISISEDSNIPWANTGSVTGQGGDASEWHLGPYCHVYLAACENLEHYRTRVKPSIQAFLSQIDAVAKYNVGGKDAVEVSKSQYVIVFVPSGNNKNPEDGPKGPGGKLGIWASARQRMVAREGSKDEKETSSGTVASNNNDSVDMDDFTSSGQQSLMSYLSRVDKEIMRRLSNDFSAGVVCQLSSLVDVSDDELAVELKKMEWAAFLKGLGTAVVNGFRERCRKYDEELRKLDQLRGAAKQASPVIDRFDYSTFFLVKESLAFSYQQLNIPAEASLQYDELQAIIPEMKANVKAKSGGALFAFSTTGESSKSQLTHGSVSGDPTAFRKRLRSVKDLQPLAHIIQQYIFARQTELSLKVKRPMEVVERCLSFVQVMYKFKRDLVKDLTNKVDLVEVESWAFKFCWDVKKACERFYADDTESVSVMEHDGPKVTSQADRALACCLCELLNFARSRFLKLGDIKLSENPIHSQCHVLTHEMNDAWAPWTPMSAKSALNEEDDDDEEGESESSLPAVTAPSGNALLDCIDTKDSYLSGYLDLLKVVEATNRSAERHRSAARIAIDMAGIYVYRKDLLRATLALRAASGVYAKDKWENTGFLVLFHLASFQRKICIADDYFNTLVRCFSPAIAKAAPSMALETLQRDLEAVLRSSLNSRPRFSSLPLFDPVLGLDGQKLSVRHASNRDTLKMVYVVGDKASLRITLHSALPIGIEVQEISVDVVPFRAYVSKIEESKSSGALDFDGDKMKVLRISGPLKVSPGKNEFSIDWYPRSTGQFVLASVSVKWHNTRFSYTCKQLKRPTVRVDVLPASPTHSVSISPEYLLPGHVQQVTISFSAGVDMVKEASMKLTCNGALTFLRPGDGEEAGEWIQSCDTMFDLCQPGETVNTRAVVKCDAAPEGMTDQCLGSFQVTVTSQYQAPLVKGNQRDSNDECNECFEKHTLEKQVTVLAKQALTVESKGISYHSRTMATAHVTLQNNIPVSLVINAWTMTLPSYLKLAQDGDLNSNLANERLGPGEQVTFAFNCEVTEDDDLNNASCLVVDFKDAQPTIYKEEFILRFKKSTAAKWLPDAVPIPVQVSPSASFGLTMEPINILFEGDLSVIAGLRGVIAYKVVADLTAWILCGKCEGIVDRKEDDSFIVSMVALPTRPGVINGYPELNLSYFEDDTVLAPALLQLKVSSMHDMFKASSAPKYTTVAVPITTKHNKFSV